MKMRNSSVRHEALYKVSNTVIDHRNENYACRLPRRTPGFYMTTSLIFTGNTSTSVGIRVLLTLR